MLDAKLQPIHEVLFMETSPIPTKWALNAMGRIDVWSPGLAQFLRALHHTSLITPLWPSTSINCPVLIFLVPIRVPTTAGNPYSRATTAP